MNPIFKNALAMTLLLSATVAVPGSYVDQTVEQILGKQLAAVKFLDSMCHSMWELQPNEVPGYEGVRGIAIDDYAAWEALGKTKSFVEKTKDAVQPYASKLASVCAPALAKAKAFGEYVYSKPQATEGARLGGYLTLDNAKNVGTKFAVAGLALYGLNKLYTYATSKSDKKAE